MLPRVNFGDIQMVQSHGGECHEASQDADKCIVCLEQYTDPCTTLIQLPCSHIFHPDCIAEWLKLKKVRVWAFENPPHFSLSFSLAFHAQFEARAVMIAYCSLATLLLRLKRSQAKPGSCPTRLAKLLGSLAAFTGSLYFVIHLRCRPGQDRVAHTCAQFFSCHLPARGPCHMFASVT